MYARTSPATSGGTSGPRPSVGRADRSNGFGRAAVMTGDPGGY